MKTAISIPNNVFEEAEKMAEKLKLSRSQLYTDAVRFYLEQTKTQDVTAKLNEVYENTTSKIGKDLLNAQATILPTEEW